MNPAEAAQAFIDCGAELAFGHHYGTFQLTDEAIDAPPIELDQALQSRGILAERFRALRPGQVWQRAASTLKSRHQGGRSAHNEFD
jgi:L-ascorbate metabolism protein UlaG (beta-lactamase superfamily)